MRAISVLLALLTLSMLAAPSSASQIRMKIDGYGPGGIPDRTIMLREDFVENGITIPLGDYSLYRPSEAYAQDEKGDVSYLPFELPIESGLLLHVSLDRVIDGNPTEGGTFLQVNGRLKGTMGGGSDRGVGGRWDSWEFDTSEPDSRMGGGEIPQALIDLLANPASYSIEGHVHGRPYSYLATELIIAGAGPQTSPPPAVPEPATLAAWGVVGLGAFVIRHRRRTAVTNASAC